MHILFLTDNFPPEVNAPASRTFEHCREWVRNGAQVTIITCAPNFPKGEVFPGYKNSLWSTELVDGIRVVRVWTYIAKNEGLLKRIFDYISFMVSASIAALFVKNVDLIIGTSPQFFTVCAAAITSRFKRVPWIFELRDIWPESIKAVGAMGDSFLIRQLEKLELFLYRDCKKIVVVTHAFKDSLIRRGINSDKIDVVTNGVDLSNYSPREKDSELVDSLGLQGCFVAGYIGTHGMAHGLETLLNAAERLKSLPEGRDVKFLFLGDGARKKDLVMDAKSRNLDNVLFLDSVSKEQVSRYWSLLDVSIIHLKKTDLFNSVIPSKLFECMGMGIPVLHGVPGESAEIVRGEEVGITFESDDDEALADALLVMKSDTEAYQGFRSRCLEGALKYNRRNLALKMLDILKKVNV
ncbi:glycosyltransferase family 4 protein [Chromobacterium violaceum]|uniref:Glycosyltransferase WbuB n=2 Tax=Chromobacterium violaceum TaxID=536 RepID=A0A202B538_CHRVL|nr:glycosyltransferase family 4 protein [Chromobacterium violaceum]AAQ61682.1 probable glycosyl transferase [Chromobacterium violaceum ATCC 12472]MBA8736598.1 glycosyltransferase family 4 protein [Chromobacterium violaceum]OVE46529.1 glycosyltransferase WbuB [Chromobacterium violaceum]SUX89125.1 putative glycosyl transferase [Chromobacterium violaceum]